MTKAEYDTVLEYSCALEAENAELKSGGGDNVTTIGTLEAASAATKPPPGYSRRCTRYTRHRCGK